MIPKISLLIPFGQSDDRRKQILDWVLKYWKCELPDAEVIIGTSSSTPFCKTEALNNAACKATGKVLVTMDADAYIRGSIIDHCADRILEAIANGHRLWYVPYRKLFRLKRSITDEILNSNPCDPLRLPSPVSPRYIDGHEQMIHYGHRYGAMVMVYPREAIDTVGCFDERFKGWGGEDVAFLRALDTLYAKHKTTDNNVMHLWHPRIGDTYRTRQWEGQAKPDINGWLNVKYHRASGKPLQMRELVDAGCEVSGKCVEISIGGRIVKVIKRIIKWIVNVFKG